MYCVQCPIQEDSGVGLNLLAMQVLGRVTVANEKLEFGESGRAFYDFFWAQYADWYIESAKTRLYSSDVAVSQTTRKVRLLLPLRRESVTAAGCCWRMLQRTVILSLL